MANSQTLIDENVNSTQIPTLSPELRAALDAPINLEKLEQAIGSAKPGKAPGPDGFTPQYYQTFLPILGPYMVDLFNELGADPALPRDTLRAHISIIPKEGKDPT